MGSRDVSRFALSVCVSIGMLAGCGGSQPPIGAPGAASQNAASHMRKASSSSGDPLYVGSEEYGVFVLTFPQGKLVTQFEPPDSALPLGMCSDQSGDVFVLAENNPEGLIYEYAHGGTSPIATLDDYSFYPTACAVDPTTGNLAVVNNGDLELSVYADAQGLPTLYNDPSMYAMNYCAYDDSGDLFVDGLGGDSGIVADLPYGGSSLTNITLDRSIGNPGSMQWMGGYLAVGSTKQVVWHIEIAGSSGTVVGKTEHKRLTSPWTIDGKQLISVYGRQRNGSHQVAYWTYPKGGAPTQFLNIFGSNSRLDGVAISVGSAK